MKCNLIELYYVSNIFLILSIEYSFTYSNIILQNEEDEIKISVSVMEALNVHQGIVVNKQVNKRMNQNNFKKFSASYVPVAYKNQTELFQYILDGQFSVFKIAVILNEEPDIIQILQQLEMVSN